MELMYIWHDCFVAKFEDFAIIFDYWTDGGQRAEFPRFLDSLDPEKPIYVLVSHHHKDHYNRHIFSWSKRFPKIRYIISKDTAKACRHIFSSTSVYSGPKPSPDQLYVLSPGASADFSNVKVFAFGSTDIGNSYLVETPGCRLFHAGDLNAWIWLDESTPAEVKKALDDYNAIVGDIKSCLALTESGRIDICMFPVDSRIGREYYTGAKIFLQEIDIAHFFPMHFALGEAEDRERYRLDASMFRLYANRKRGEYIALQSPYASFMMPE